MAIFEHSHNIRPPLDKNRPGVWRQLLSNSHFVHSLHVTFCVRWPTTIQVASRRSCQNFKKAAVVHSPPEGHLFVQQPVFHWSRFELKRITQKHDCPHIRSIYRDCFGVSSAEVAWNISFQNTSSTFDIVALLMLLLAVEPSNLCLWHSCGCHQPVQQEVCAA